MRFYSLMGLDQSILIYTFPRQSPFLGFQCNENTQESTLNLSFLYLKSCSSGKLRITLKVKGDKAACKANEKVCHIYRAF